MKAATHIRSSLHLLLLLPHHVVSLLDLFESAHSLLLVMSLKIANYKLRIPSEMEVTLLCLYFSNCFTLHKHYSSMYVFICIDAYKGIQYIIYNVRTLLEWANA